MAWDDDDSILGRQIRDNKGNLIGWVKKDKVTGESHIFDKKGTVGWSKPHDKSGPGWTISSKDGRVAHTDSPEYLLGMKKQKDEDERRRREQERHARRHDKPPKPGSDGSDPKYK